MLDDQIRFEAFTTLPSRAGVIAILLSLLFVSTALHKLVIRVPVTVQSVRVTVISTRAVYLGRQRRCVRFLAGRLTPTSGLRKGHIT
jgi:hypothetical protein